MSPYLFDKVLHFRFETAQIAHELGLAENTVKVHVTAILKKLECYSRTQAAVLVKSLENDHEV